MEVKDKPLLLEQYKLYVEMADRVSDRRLKTNQFYVTLISGLLVVLGFLFYKDKSSVFIELQVITALSVVLLGLVLNTLWTLNIRSYRQLNSGKFKVIHEMEGMLPFKTYAREWEIIREGQKKDKYFQLTRVEKYLPLVLSLPYLLLLAWIIF